MEDKSVKYGKVVYIEPNDILEDVLYNKKPNEGSLNAVHPYDDYCISVDLFVKIMNGEYVNKEYPIK